MEQENYYNQSKFSLQRMSLGLESASPSPLPSPRKRIRPDQPVKRSDLGPSSIRLFTGDDSPSEVDVGDLSPIKSGNNLFGSLNQGRPLDVVDEETEGFKLSSTSLSSFQPRSREEKDISPTDVASFPEYSGTPMKRVGVVSPSELPPPSRLSFSGACSTFEKDFEEIRQIGNGSFGTVYEVIHRIDGCRYAVKVSKTELRNEAETQKMLQEVRSLATMSGGRPGGISSQQSGEEVEGDGETEGDGDAAHFVRYYSAWLDGGGGRLCIQMELCDRTLEDLLKGGVQSPAQVEAEAWRCARHLLRALRALHGGGMVHLDIKPANIFVKNGRYKLGDFGLALNVGAPSGSGSGSGGGDVEEGDCRYMARELLDFGPKDLKKCDIFSLGMTLFELCSFPRKPLPPRGEEWQQLRANASRQFATLATPGLQEVVAALLDEDPAARPSAGALLAAAARGRHPGLLRASERALAEAERRAAAAAAEARALRGDVNRHRITNQVKRKTLHRSHTIG